MGPRATVINSILVALFACCGVSEDPEPHVTPVPGVERCGEACAHMSGVGPDGGSCEEAEPVPVPDGGHLSCADFCVYQHANGVFWNTDCLVTITSCEQIETVCNVPAP